MDPLKVLVCGGGCAGPALAYWLARSGHQVTVIERFPVLRVAGSQIDLRGAGIEAANRMGLLDTIRGRLVDEAGSVLVDSQGNAKGKIMANNSGKGAQSFTSEYEIMRGDLVCILYEATKDNVEYIFDKSVELFEQDDNQVTVTFSDGSSDTFDLLVGADGQGSRIRKAILPPGTPDPYFKFGYHVAYWFVPRSEGDDNMMNVYHCPGGRMIIRRSHSAAESQVMCFLRDSSPKLCSIPKASMDKQKEFWTQQFRDAGWQAERFLEGMKTTDKWYCQEVVQVRTETWSKGRVVLLGDAAYCPSPFSGMGTSAALVGAYILAGEISQHGDDFPQAFANYDKNLRPFVKEVQQVNLFLLKLGMPDTWWGIAILHFIFQTICFFKIPKLLSRFMKEKDGDWQLPDYPELKAADK
jgi:2-polyprenyl-6-methoxyphenol hydroxylase-like FAD-dependent oxidoreductase